jgi:hypothetical protein
LAITGGRLSIVDGFDGSTIASHAVGPDQTSVSVIRTFAAGDHPLTARYSGDGDYGPSQARLALAVAVDSSVDARRLRVAFRTYPSTTATEMSIPSRETSASRLAS